MGVLQASAIAQIVIVVRYVLRALVVKHHIPIRGQRKAIRGRADGCGDLVVHNE